MPDPGNTRLEIIERHLPDHTAEAFRQAITDLRAMTARIPRDSFPVKKVWLQVAPAWEDDFWTLITPAKLDFPGARSSQTTFRRRSTRSICGVSHSTKIVAYQSTSTERFCFTPSSAVNAARR